MYGQFMCTVRPKKAEPNWTRSTVGGDRINYPVEVATPTAEMLVAKMHFNSVISTKCARFMTMGISNFYHTVAPTGIHLYEIKQHPRQGHHRI